MKEIDSRKHELEYFTRKFHPYHLLIDVEARKSNMSMLPAYLKCITGFNQHRERDNLINKMKSELYDVCG